MFDAYASNHILVAISLLSLTGCTALNNVKEAGTITVLEQHDDEVSQRGMGKQSLASSQTSVLQRAILS